MALEPYKQLPREIESLKAVIEMKTEENRELRSENNKLKQKVRLNPCLWKFYPLHSWSMVFGTALAHPYRIHGISVMVMLNAELTVL